MENKELEVKAEAKPEAKATAAATPRVSGIKKKDRKNILTAIAHVKSSFNNTIVSITDVSGSVISWGSAGERGFKGSKKNTSYAAQVVAESAGKKAMEQGVRNMSVFVKGAGAGRESVIRAFHALGIKITFVKDVTPIPHNGCRPPKKRRI